MKDSSTNYLTGGGGHVYAVTAPISGNATIEQLYQSERFGKDMTYVIDNLPNGDYDVFLHFAEIYHQAANKREFNIKLQGVDIFLSMVHWIFGLKLVLDLSLMWNIDS